MGPPNEVSPNLSATQSTSKGEFAGVRVTVAVLLFTRVNGSCAIKQRHEPKVHVKLLVAVKQRQAGIVGNKVEFQFLVTAEHHHILHDARSGFAGDSNQLKAMPMQMHGMDVVARVSHANPITLTPVDAEHR